MEGKPKLTRDRGNEVSPARGMLFKRLRLRLGLTRERLHEVTGLSREKITQLEKGCCVADDETVFPLAELYRVPADELLYEDPKKIFNKFAISSCGPKATDVGEFVEKILETTSENWTRGNIPSNLSIEALARLHSSKLEKASRILETTASVQHTRGKYPDSFFNSYAAGLMRAACGSDGRRQRVLAVNSALDCLKVLRAIPIRTWIWQTTSLIEQVWDASFKPPPFLCARLMSELGAYAVESWAASWNPASLCAAASRRFEKALRADNEFVSLTEVKRMGLFNDRMRWLFVGLQNCDSGITQLNRVIQAHEDIGDSYGGAHAQVALSAVLAFHNRRSQFFESEQTHSDKINEANKHSQLFFSAAKGYMLLKDGKPSEAEALFRTVLTEMSDLSIRAALGPAREPLPFLQFDTLLGDQRMLKSKPIPKLDYFPLIDVFQRLYNRAKAGG